jgi:hypothetical protein
MPVNLSDMSEQEIGIAATGELAMQLFLLAAPFFAGGLATALLAGLFAWLN